MVRGREGNGCTSPPSSYAAMSIPANAVHFLILWVGYDAPPSADADAIEERRALREHTNDEGSEVIAPLDRGERGETTARTKSHEKTAYDCFYPGPGRRKVDVYEYRERADRYSLRGVEKVPTYSAIAGRQSHTNARARRRAGHPLHRMHAGICGICGVCKASLGQRVIPGASTNKVVVSDAMRPSETRRSLRLSQIHYVCECHDYCSPVPECSHRLSNGRAAVYDTAGWR